MTNLQRLSVHFWHLHLFTQKPDVIHYYVHIKYCCVNVELNIYIRHISMTNLQRLSVHFWHLHLFTQKPDVMHYYVCIKHCCVNIKIYIRHINDESIFVTSQWRMTKLQRLSVHFWYLHLFTQKPDVMYYYVRIKHCCVNVELKIYIRHISMTNLQRLSVHFWYLHLFTQKPDIMHYYVRIKHCCVNVELNRSIFVTSQWRICRDYQYIFDIYIYLLRNQM